VVLRLISINVPALLSTGTPGPARLSPHRDFADDASDYSPPACWLSLQVTSVNSLVLCSWISHRPTSVALLCTWSNISIPPSSPFLSWQYHLETADLVNLNDINYLLALGKSIRPPPRQGHRPGTQSASRPHELHAHEQGEHPIVVTIAPSVQIQIFHPQSFMSSQIGLTTLRSNPIRKSFLLVRVHERALGEVQLGQSIPLKSFLLRIVFVVLVCSFTFVNTALSSSASSKSVVTKLSSSLVGVLAFPYSASSTPTISSFNNPLNSNGLEWPVPANKPECDRLTRIVGTLSLTSGCGAAFPYPRFKEYCAEADAEHKWTELEYIDTSRGDPTNVAFTAKVNSERWFDWAGKVNETQCPLNIVKWPKGLEMEFITTGSRSTSYFPSNYTLADNWNRYCIRDIEGGHPIMSKTHFSCLACDLEYGRRDVSTSSGRIIFAHGYL